VQGIELRRPLRSTEKIEEIVAAIRERVEFLETDRYLAPDIASTTELIETGYFYTAVSNILPSGSTDKPTF
jgi:histidine ammonia-lyase